MFCLLNFFHKDGSIGNVYGSRGSSLIYPYGMVKAGGPQLLDELSNSVNLSKIPRQNFSIRPYRKGND